MLKIEVLADINQAVKNLNTLQKEANESFSSASKAISETNTRLSKFGDGLKNLATSFAGGLGIAVAFSKISSAATDAFDAFVKYERALVGVGKTTNMSGKELNNFGKEIIDLSKEMPVAAEELLAITQAAGQLGVKGSENLLNFTETVAKLGFATNLVGEDGATALVRILNVTNEGIDKIDELGSVIVRLGNNFAASESEIVGATTELARGIGQFGVASREAAALGVSLQSLGVQAESGGTVITNAFIKIQEAIIKGGEKLKTLEKITGMTGDALRREFKDNAIGVFQSFLDGLVRLDQQGVQKITTSLEQFELTGARTSKVIPVLAQRTDILKDALNQANEEFKNATALNNEAAAAFQTTAAKIEVFNNQATAASITMGQQLAPVFLVLKERMLSLKLAAADVFSRLFPPEEEKQLKNAEDKIQGLNESLRFLKLRRDEIQARGILTPVMSAVLDDVNKKIFETRTQLKEAASGGLALASSFNQVTASAQVAAKNVDDIANETVAKNAQRAEEERKRLEEEEVIKTQLYLIKLQERLDTQSAIIEESNLKDIEKATKQREVLTKILDEELAKKTISQKQYNDSVLSYEKKISDQRVKVAQNQAKEEAIIQKKKSENFFQIESGKIEWEKKSTKEKVEFTRDYLQQIAGLTASNNKTLFAIGKAAAIATATVDGVLAVQKTLASVPFPFSIPLAATIGIATAANVSRITSQPPPKFAEGGIVPGSSTSGDRVLARVNSGEMILNQSQQARLFDQISTGGSDSSLASAIYALGDRIANIEIVLRADDIEIARSVNRAINDGYVLARTA